MDAAAKVTSKGQVTVPKAVRDALGIKEGDEVFFRVEGNRAVLARTPDFLALAGSIRFSSPSLLFLPAARCAVITRGCLRSAGSRACRSCYGLPWYR